ncbi:hypothetical protein D9M72_519610 [compost metagenome]
MGQRRENFKRLARFACRGLRRNEAPGAGIVQPVGEFDHQHPDVLGHRHDHLPDRFGLRGFAEAHLVQFCYAVNEHGHLGTEVPLEVRQRVRRIFNRVVQEGGCQRRAAQAQFRQDGGHRDRVRDVRIAALAFLPPVALFRHDEGTLDEVEVLFGIVCPDGAEQRFEYG